MLAELEFGAAHDEGCKQVEGFGGVGGWKIGELFVDELVGLSRYIAADQSGLEDMKCYVFAGCVGRRQARGACVHFGA